MSKAVILVTPDEFAERMKRIAENENNIFIDQEDSHRAADDLMCELLYDLGYKKGIEIFEDMPKWYA